MNAPSLNGFLTITDARYRLFDLGTQVRKLPASQLADLDNGAPYPLPHLGYAWLVIFLWNPQQTMQNSFWFFKLPLDEQGILSAAAHNDLVNRLYRSVQISDEQERQRLLTDHPYQFQPDPEKMAALHARATHLLGLPASDYLGAAQEFYQGHHCQHRDWQSLGIQGIADLLCRAQPQDFSALNQRLQDLPMIPACQLIRQMEHWPIPTNTVETLLALLIAHAAEPMVVNACLRGASQAQSIRLLDNYLATTLTHKTLELETLLIILTRYLHLLTDHTMRIRLLDQLAQQADADGFQRVVTNLAMQPGMCGLVRNTLASEALTAPLANALSHLIQHQKRQHGQV